MSALAQRDTEDLVPTQTLMKLLERTLESNERTAAAMAEHAGATREATVAQRILVDRVNELIAVQKATTRQTPAVSPQERLLRWAGRHAWQIIVVLLIVAMWIQTMWVIGARPNDFGVGQPKKSASAPTAVSAPAEPHQEASR